MSQKTLVLLGDTQAVIVADTAAAASSVAMRDASGNSAFAQVSATELKGTQQLTLPTPVTKTTSFTAAIDTDCYVCDATSGSIVPTLPPAAGVTGRCYTFHKKNAANSVTVTGSGAELIDGANTSVLTTQYSTLRIRSDGTQWWSC